MVVVVIHTSVSADPLFYQEICNLKKPSSVRSSVETIMEATIWLSILSIVLLFIFSLLRSNPKKTKLPPSPSKLPIIGNLHQLGALPYRTLRDLSLKHGSLMQLQLGCVPTLVVSSADLAQQFMKTQDLNFASRPSMSAGKKMIYNNKDVGLAPYGEYWRQMKKICVVELFNTKRVDSFAFVRDEEVTNMMKTIYNLSKDVGVVNMRDVLVCFTNDIICRVALGKRYSGKEGGVAELFRETNELLGTFSFGDYFPALGFLDVLSGVERRQRNVFQRLDAFLGGIIEDHLKTQKDEREHTDFVDVLLHVQKHSALDIPLTMNDIKAVILNVISAGAETTSTALEWVMVELVKHPEIMKKAQEELRGVAGGKSKIQDMDIQKMVYLKSIIKETLRLHPVLPLLVPRQCIKNTKIQGYDVPTDTVVYINAWAIGRDPASWERPEEFEPERFMNSDRDYQGQDFTFIPFGAGRRSCPGMSFAIPVIEIAVANLMHRFDWGLPNEMNPQDLDMAEVLGIASTMKSDLLVVATPHFN